MHYAMFFLCILQFRGQIFSKLKAQQHWTEILFFCSCEKQVLHILESAVHTLCIMHFYYVFLCILQFRGQIQCIIQDMHDEVMHYENFDCMYSMHVCKGIGHNSYKGHANDSREFWRVLECSISGITEAQYSGHLYSI